MKSEIDKAGNRPALDDVSGDRRDGDPLVCECPVCTRAKRAIEETGVSEEIGKRVGFFITEDGCRWPEDRSGNELRPNLNEAVSLPSGEDGFQIRRRSADDAKEDMTDNKSRRLTVIRRFAWTADGRFA